MYTATWVESNLIGLFEADLIIAGRFVLYASTEMPSPVQRGEVVGVCERTDSRLGIGA
jgi:hypothetical protein